MIKAARFRYVIQTQLKAFPLILIFLINLISLEFSSWNLPLYPFLGLAFYFHWMIYRPDCLPPIALALLTFISNTWLSDSPSLILPAIYLGFYPVLLKYRLLLFNQKFTKVWGSYFAFAVLTTLFYWTAKALIEKEYFLISNLLMSISVTVLFYPILTLLNSSFQHLVPLR